MGRPVTIIQANTRISGRLEGAEDVELLGSIQGSVQLDGSLFVDKAAQVQADVEVTRLEVHGVLVGSVLASESIELFGEAKVIGDLTAPKVIIHEGALYRGAIDMGGESADEGRGGRNSPPPARRPSPQRVAPARPRTAPRSTPTQAPAAIEPAKAPLAAPKADKGSAQPVGKKSTKKSK